VRTRNIVIIVGMLAILALPVACAVSFFQSLGPHPECKDTLATGSVIRVGDREYKYGVSNFTSFVKDANRKLVGFIYSTEETGDEFFQSNKAKTLVRVPPANERVGTTRNDEEAFLKQRSLQLDIRTACGVPGVEGIDNGLMFGGPKCRGASRSGASLTAGRYALQVKFVSPVTDARGNLRGWVYTTMPTMRWIFASVDRGAPVVIPDRLIGGAIPYTDTVAYIHQRFGAGATEEPCISAGL
jgi:hypothetical protein